ncbi:hypothetical protein JCM33374_g4598 [Metschnikowia sp. JCM 33374]|nr:hypothetical protein JCM33374_g4598 [Metschnikowia sp. JCM 33374]
MFSSTPRPPPLPLLKKPLYSFVDVFSTYPCWGFSPRIWTAAGDSVPKQSVWAKGCMDRSVELLKAYSVDLTPLVRNIGAGIFSGNGTKSITQAVIESMELLSICASPNDACLHLYLVVILVIFPVILASDQEVSCEAKASLRSDLKACVAHLETDVAEWESVDRKSLRNFTRILRMMTHLNQMTSSQVPPKCARSVMAEMVHDINLQGKKNGCPGEVSPMESMLFRAVVTAVNAYNVTLTEDGLNSEFDTIQKIENIVKVIWKETMLTTEALQTIINKEDIASNVPYQVFTIFGTTFHNVTVSYPETAKLPVQVVTCMVQHFTKDMQDARFRQFGKLEQDLCTETFRCWWIFSSMFQEYVSVISEVVALSQTVS